MIQLVPRGDGVELASRIQAVNSQKLRYSHGGEASAGSGSPTACLRLPVPSRGQLADTLDKPQRSFLLWKEQRLLLRPGVGSWELPATAHAGGCLAVTSDQGGGPL